jgi:CMP-N-acetylneuraminic acid synthetase
MKVVIPAKASSTRVVNKNWRPFYANKSLVEITIDKLRKAKVKAKDIFVSSEDARMLYEIRKSHKVNGLVRDPLMCENETLLTRVIRSLHKQIGTPNEFALVCCTSPTFDEYRDCLANWKLVKDRFDSYVVAYPSDTHRLLGQSNDLYPLGWSFGANHTNSQAQQSYSMPFSFSILTKKSVEETGYFVGRKPYWHVSKSWHIDINTPEDFYDAQAIYYSRISRDPEKTQH